MTLAWVAAVVLVGLGGVPVAEIAGGNALTLPAHRHMVRVVHPDGSASLWLAIQQDGARGRGLNFYRSDDEGQHWTRAAPIQDNPGHRDRADVIQIGQDMALVYSYEGPSLSGSTQHDVYYQRWRYQPSSKSFTPDAPVRVFDSSSSSTAYYRGEITTDSLGRIWVQAFRLNPGGSHTAVIAVSQDGGLTFQHQPELATVSHRGGGRILSLGNTVIFLFHHHGPSGPAQYRLRHDMAPLHFWSPVETAFNDGIYHGAALSAVALGNGKMHLVYKSNTEQRLWYRFYDGEDFGARQQIDDSAWWSTQAATTLVGDDLYVFYNRAVQPETNYQVRVRRVSGGVVGPPVVLDQRQTFKGYPTALARVPETVGTAPSVFGIAGDANSAGRAEVLFAELEGGSVPPPPPPDGPALFSDDFSRTGYNLGGHWRQDQGRWLTNGHVAGSDQNGADLAYVPSVSCRDCSVEASVVGFGVPEAALVLRVQNGHSPDRYELVLLGSGHVQLRRKVGSSTAVLGTAPAGVPLWDWSMLRLSAVGTGPVTLTAWVRGVPVLSVVDDSPGPLNRAGHAGIWTTRAGVGFDRFRIIAE